MPTRTLPGTSIDWLVSVDSNIVRARGSTPPEQLKGAAGTEVRITPSDAPDADPAAADHPPFAKAIYRHHNIAGRCLNRCCDGYAH